MDTPATRFHFGHFQHDYYLTDVYGNGQGYGRMLIKSHHIYIPEVLLDDGD